MRVRYYEVRSQHPNYGVVTLFRAASSSIMKSQKKKMATSGMKVFSADVITTRVKTLGPVFDLCIC